ncbi:hypothetical protein GCK72_020724 [Caenorhabditis remanei]|uniref:DUF7154 domain-containing protein n=1 Tax=Caenorhabditis remanei TaxID=31234 RepID=A0A6A5GHC2_CAERE|nr:hypothetical protein GCK72_020724 [Caenorhabditis remanei]KAF1754164.1 hypothetical protein GCK72_020724 [Caenorhabditis remanei]
MFLLFAETISQDDLEFLRKSLIKSPSFDNFNLSYKNLKPENISLGPPFVDDSQDVWFFKTSDFKRTLAIVHEKVDEPHFLFTTVDESKVPEAPDACTPRTNSTILYAYSNDLDAYDVNMLRSSIVFTNRNIFYGYTTFANVRFDVHHEEEIQYHSDVFSFNASVTAHMPNSSLSYGDSATGSDVFNVLKRYLENDQATLCGSIVYIVAKRYPNQVDLTSLITQLRANHVFVYVVAHAVPSGGNNPHALFEVASKTNGFCVFNSGNNFWISVDNLSYVNYRKYQFFSQNYAVTGSGRIELPLFTPNPTVYSEQMLVVITVQDHKIDSTFVALNYTIESVDGSFVWTGPDIGSGYPRFGTGILAQPQLNGSTDYKLTIDYHYATGQQQVIETRLHSNFYHDFVPFAN